MQINSIRVQNFRNLAEQEISLIPGLNIFVGNNAQGKTNLLEAVYLCCLGKSVRTDKDKDLINWEQEACYACVNCTTKVGSKNISVAVSNNKKVASVNTLPLTRIGELLGNINCIFFSPDEIRVITASPHERRRFLDIDLCQLDKQYYHSLVRFNKILTQRNNLIKKAVSFAELTDMLSAWDIQLVKEGAILTYKRKNFCRDLAPLVTKAHTYLTTTEQMQMSYLPCVKGDTQEEISANYTKKLEENREKDFTLRYTTFGCQRDDIRFVVDDIDMRQFGSQGQQRTTALSLKLAELQLFYDLTGDYPILLLDDVLSELDRSRQKALLSFNTQVQIILTATKVDAMLVKKLNYARYTIKNGVAYV